MSYSLELNAIVFIDAILKSDLDIVGLKVQTVSDFWYTMRVDKFVFIELVEKSYWGSNPRVLDTVIYHELDKECIQFMLAIAPLKDWIPYYE